MNKQQDQILQAVARLDMFAAQASMPRGWHAQWQAVYQETVASLHTICEDEKKAQSDAAKSEK